MKNLPAVWENQVQSLSLERLLEKEMATHSSILAWEFHGQRNLVAAIHGVAKSQTRLSPGRDDRGLEQGGGDWGGADGIHRWGGEST